VRFYIPYKQSFTMAIRKGLAWISLLPILLFMGCSGGGGGGTSDLPLATIALSSEKVYLTANGETATLNATGLDAKGKALAKQPVLHWASSDTTIATVDSAGVITAGADGQVTVTVSSGEVSSSSQVIVDSQPVSIQLSVDDPVLTAIDSVTLAQAAIVNNYDVPLSTQPTFIWSSSNEAVATVGSDGTITAKAEGQATITAMADGLTQTFNIIVSIGGIPVSGYVTYGDKEYDQNGFTGAVSDKAVRYALVDLVDTNGNIVDTTYTDATGLYAFSTLLTGLEVRVMAQTDSSTGLDVAVSDINGDLYAVTYTVPETGSTSLDVQIPVSGSIAGAFNMLDVFTAGLEFAKTLSSQVFPTLNIYWRANNSSYGTYYCWENALDSACPQGAGIYILGGGFTSNDTDEFDDDVLWHEFSHYAESLLTIDDSPGGTHYLTDNDLDLRLSWSEGWGDFFPTVVKTWLKEQGSNVLSADINMSATNYIDTQGTIASISVDLSNPGLCGSGTDCYVYSSNEVAVAKILTTLVQDYGSQAVWDIYERYLSPLTSTPATMESFWDGWLALRAPDSVEMNNLETIFSERSIYYLEDGYEADGGLDENRRLTVCTSSCAGETHYLYRQDGTPDIDYIAFDAQQGVTYTIETFDLKNGADTNLRLFDTLGNLLPYENDDRPGTTYCYPSDDPCRIHNDDTMLSSVLTFTPTTSGIYYIEVSNTPDPTPVAGRYGTYSLRITQ
jgi:uncharacterized protein YcfL